MLKMQGELDPTEVYMTIDDFFSDINVLKYNHDYSELSFSRAKKNYERILKRLAALNLPDPKSFTFQTMTVEEIITTLKSLLVKIVGDERLPFINHLESLIKKTNMGYYFDSAVEENIRKSVPEVENIYIDRSLYNIQVASTGHEFIHGMLTRYKGRIFNDHFTNIHYNELLPILVEYILCYELSQLLKDPNIEASHEVIRISHDHIQAHELLEARNTSRMAYNSKVFGADFARKYGEYQEHNAFTYILDDIYSIHLLDRYKDSPETLIKIVRAILNGEKTLLDLIKYYDLSLRNPDSLRLYDEQIDRALKYKK